MRTRDCLLVSAIALLLGGGLYAADGGFWGGGFGEDPMIVINAVDAKKVVAPMRFLEDPTAAKGKCLEIPDSGAGGKKIPTGVGHAEFEFNVDKSDTYVLYIRAWWPDGCGNSVLVSIDGKKAKPIEDSTNKIWHWVKLRLKKYKLDKGKHTVVVTNREDGARFDQIVLTTEAASQPVGIIGADD